MWFLSKDHSLNLKCQGGQWQLANPRFVCDWYVHESTNPSVGEGSKFNTCLYVQNKTQFKLLHFQTFEKIRWTKIWWQSGKNTTSIWNSLVKPWQNSELAQYFFHRTTAVVSANGTWTESPVVSFHQEPSRARCNRCNRCRRFWGTLIAPTMLFLKLWWWCLNWCFEGVDLQVLMVLAPAELGWPWLSFTSPRKVSTPMWRGMTLKGIP